MGKGYALAVERLFLLRNFLAPVEFTEDTNWTRTISRNLEKEEKRCAREHPLMVNSMLMLSIKQQKQTEMNLKQ